MTNLYSFDEKPRHFNKVGTNNVEANSFEKWSAHKYCWICRSKRCKEKEAVDVCTPELLTIWARYRMMDIIDILEVRNRARDTLFVVWPSRNFFYASFKFPFSFCDHTKEARKKYYSCDVEDETTQPSRTIKRLPGNRFIVFFLRTMYSNTTKEDIAELGNSHIWKAMAQPYMARSAKSSSMS